MARKTPQETIDEIIRLYTDDRKGAPFIAERLGIDPKTVASIVKEYGIARHSLHKLTPEQEQEVVAMYLGGSTVREIGSLYGMSGGGIARLLERNGCQRRHSSYTDEQIDALIALYQSGMTGKEIQDQTGVAPSVVSYFIQQRGLTGRTASDYRTYTINDYAFDDLSDEQASYWYGFIMADGHVQKMQGIQIALWRNDYSHLRKFQAFLQTDTPITFVDNGTENGACKIVGWSTHLAARLTSLGIVSRRLAEFDPYVMPPESYRHFARGLMDGDGNIDVRIPKNKQTAVLRVRFMGNLSTLSWLKTAIEQQAGVFTDGQIYQRVGIMGLDYGSSLKAYGVLQWLYDGATVWMDRKREKYEAYLAYRGWE